MKEIHLTQGQTTFVDDEDYVKLSKFKWCAAILMKPILTSLITLAITLLFAGCDSQPPETDPTRKGKTQNGGVGGHFSGGN